MNLTFKIEQIAIILPRDPSTTKTNPLGEKLLRAIGCSVFSHDTVIADGTVGSSNVINKANLRFNYEIGPVEFEVLHYEVGNNWRNNEPGVSHLGMHVSASELEQWRKMFESNGVKVIQEVKTVSHTNPVIKDSRRYHYVIFNTRPLIGVDLKFIVRLNLDGTPFAGE